MNDQHDNKKGMMMAAHAIIPTNEVDSFLLNNPLIRKPKSGVSMIAIQAMPMPDCENDIV